MTATDAADLTERFFPLARSIARKWASRFPNLRDEFHSEAAFALWRAAVKFPGGDKFATFAHPRLRWAMLSVVTRESRHYRGRGRVDAGDEPLEPLEPLDPLDLVASREPDPARAVEILDLVVLERLPARWRESLERMARDGTAADLAAERRTTLSAVHQQARKALQHLWAGACQGGQADGFLAATASNPDRS